MRNGVSGVLSYAGWNKGRGVYIWQERKVNPKWGQTEAIKTKEEK